MSYQRSKETSKRYKRLHKKIGHYYMCSIYYSNRKQRLVRVYSAGRKSGTAKWIRNQANRRVRRTKDIGNNSCYRKLYDYWYELY